MRSASRQNSLIIARGVRGSARRRGAAAGGELRLGLTGNGGRMCHQFSGEARTATVSGCVTSFPARRGRRRSPDVSPLLRRGADGDGVRMCHQFSGEARMRIRRQSRATESHFGARIGFRPRTAALRARLFSTSTINALRTLANAGPVHLPLVQRRSAQCAWRFRQWGGCAGPCVSAYNMRYGRIPPPSRPSSGDCEC